MFEIGDRVRLTQGKAPLRITRINHRKQIAEIVYESTLRGGTDYDPLIRSFDRIVSYPKEDKMSKQPQLYRVRETQEYGTFLAKTRSGNIALEMKGSGKVVDFSADAIEEVVPYTVEICFESGPNVHIEVPEGKLKKGDIIMHGMNLGIATAIDTKCKSPTNLAADKPFRRLVTEDIA